MEINKIAITGGPCAGKSKAIGRVSETFSGMGYKVIVVPESTADLEHQPDREQEAEKEARKCDADKVIILCEGGTVSLRDSYDAVFFMESTADENLLSCWVGTPHLRIISCGENVEETLDALCAEIAFFLGEPEPLEIERKFLIEYPDLSRLEEDPLCHKVEISQSYIDDPNGGFRIRKRGEGDDCLYFLTRKKRISDARRIEIESRITKEEYLKILSDAGENAATVSKDRYCMVYAGKYFEVDIFPFWNDRALVEIELKSEDEEFTLPPQFKVIREVTSEREYTNRAIAMRLPFFGKI